LTIEDSSGFWIIAFAYVISAVGHYSPDHMTQLVGHGSSSNKMVFVLAMLSPPKITQIALGNQCRRIASTFLMLSLLFLSFLSSYPCTLPRRNLISDAERSI
jgi:hypothetical protein